MATNLDLDPSLVEDALRVSGKRTKREAVTDALVEYVTRRTQGDLADLFGTLDWDESYDYKADRV